MIGATYPDLSAAARRAALAGASGTMLAEILVNEADMGRAIELVQAAEAVARKLNAMASEAAR